VLYLAELPDSIDFIQEVFAGDPGPNTNRPVLLPMQR
jgi:hypothetical protein